MGDKVQYNFNFSGEGGDGAEYPSRKSVDISVDFDDDIPWTAVADEFFNFLSSVYGYRCDPKKYAARFGPKPPTPWEDE